MGIRQGSRVESLSCELHTKVLRTTYIKKGFWPPLKPKNENYFSPTSLDGFIR